MHTKSAFLKKFLMSTVPEIGGKLFHLYFMPESLVSIIFSADYEIIIMPPAVGGGIKQWCIAKNGGGYTQRAMEKGLKVPCLFMITEVSICCQKNLEVGIRRIPAYTPQYTTGIKWCCDLSVCLFVCPSHLAQLGVQCLGQATWAVQTADPSVHGRRSAVMGGGISSHHAITC